MTGQINPELEGDRNRHATMEFAYLQQSYRLALPSTHPQPSSSSTTEIPQTQFKTNHRDDKIAEFESDAKKKKSRNSINSIDSRRICPSLLLWRSKQHIAHRYCI